MKIIIQIYKMDNERIHIANSSMFRLKKQLPTIEKVLISIQELAGDSFLEFTGTKTKFIAEFDILIKALENVRKELTLYYLKQSEDQTEVMREELDELLELCITFRKRVKDNWVTMASYGSFKRSIIRLKEKMDEIIEKIRILLEIEKEKIR